MFVFPNKYVTFLLSLFFFVTGLGYFLSYKSDNFKPVQVLTILHVVLTFIGLLLLFLVPKYGYNLPVETAEDMLENHRISKLYQAMRFYGWIGIFSAQPVLLLNLTISIFRK